jgi:hypothetical protein
MVARLQPVTLCSIPKTRSHTHKGFRFAAECDSSSIRSIRMARYELTEFEWKVIEPLLPNKPRGVRG